MDPITVYEKPTCSTCREVVALLRERGAEFDTVDYLSEGLGEETLRDLLARAGLRPRDVVRTKEPGARALPLDDDEATLRALLSDLTLLQRPLVRRGERVILARPPDRVLDLLP